MYNVMIVDDETIILSGIRSLVDWEKNDCVLAATARNGQDALDQIRRMPIDIMLVDLNMPVMDGITLMEIVHREFPNIVFIVLTNLEEFELARKALQCRAVGYLLKSRLEAVDLETALGQAKEERGKRKQLMVTNAAEYFEKERQKNIVSKALEEVLFFQHGLRKEEHRKILADSGVLCNYAYFYVPFDFLSGSGGEPPEKEAKAKIMDWIRGMIDKTAQNLFKEDYILLDPGSANSQVLFVYRIQDAGEAVWEKKAEMFARKLSSAVKTVTQVECRVFRTGLHNGYDELEQCAAEYHALMEEYYLDTPEAAVASFSERTYEPLGLKGVGLELYHEIMQRNLKGITSVMDHVEARVRNTVHQKGQAIWLLNELNREASAALAKFGVMETSTYERVSSIAAIENINTRGQVLAWLNMLRNTLVDVVGGGDMPGSPLAEKARKYVLENIEACISLQDAAAHVGVSAGYLSTIFKREYEQSFVDFVNRTKMEYACLLLEEKNLMVMEIAYRLGYENAYYFSKVFRKYMGMSPTDYQKRIEDEKSTNSGKK